MDHQSDLQPLTKLQGYGGAPFTFDLEGKTLAIGACGGYSIFGCDQSKIILFDTVKEEFLEQPFEGDAINGTVNYIAFSPDRRFLVSGSANRDISFWDLATHQIIGQPIPILGSIKTAIFTTNGKMLITNTDYGNVLLWDTDPEFWVELLCQRSGRNFTRRDGRDIFQMKNIALHVHSGRWNPKQSQHQLQLLNPWIQHDRPKRRTQKSKCQRR